MYTTIHPPGVCACHGEPLGAAGTKRLCRIKQRLRTRAYQATVGGQAAKAKANSCRVFVGQRYVLSSDTPGEATALNAHVRARISAFTHTQKGGRRGALA